MEKIFVLNAKIIIIYKLMKRKIKFAKYVILELKKNAKLVEIILVLVVVVTKDIFLLKMAHA